MLLEQYLKNCGITDITSNAIYFKPNIPGDKLSNAVNAYGVGVGKNEVLVLIDDTFWGSAKEGILITDDALLFKVAGHGSGRYDLSLLRNAASVNQRRILTSRGCGQKLGLLGGSSCTRTKTASARLGST